MKYAPRQLVLMTAAATALTATGLAQADSLFGGGNRDFAGQQRFEKDKADKDKADKGGSQGESSSNWPASARVDTPNQVPEPETLSLVAIGLLAAWAASRRRKD